MIRASKIIVKNNFPVKIPLYMYHTFKNNILKMILKKKKKNTYRLKNNSNHFYFPNLIFIFYMFLSNSIDERGHSIDFNADLTRVQHTIIVSRFRSSISPISSRLAIRDL